MAVLIGPELIIPSLAEAARASLLPVPGGTFTMGASDLSNAPVHEETVAAFRMGKNTPTNEEHARVVKKLGKDRLFLLETNPKTGVQSIVARGSNARKLAEAYQDRIFKDLGAKRADIILLGGLTITEVGEHKPPKGFDRDRQPAVTVNWYDSMAHAAVVGCRLAFEAEWEFAATEGGKKKYATRSGKLTREEAHYASESTIDVDDPRYPDGPYGIRHLTGNVLEWTNSLWKPGEPYMVLRGGFCGYIRPGFLRAAYRGDNGPEVRYKSVGFRLAAPEDSPK